MLGSSVALASQSKVSLWQLRGLLLVMRSDNDKHVHAHDVTVKSSCACARVYKRLKVHFNV